MHHRVRHSRLPSRCQPKNRRSTIPLTRALAVGTCSCGSSAMPPSRMQRQSSGSKPQNGPSHHNTTCALQLLRRALLVEMLVLADRCHHSDFETEPCSESFPACSLRIYIQDCSCLKPRLDLRQPEMKTAEGACTGAQLEAFRRPYASLEHFLYRVLREVYRGPGPRPGRALRSPPSNGVRSNKREAGATGLNKRQRRLDRSEGEHAAIAEVSKQSVERRRSKRRPRIMTTKTIRPALHDVDNRQPCRLDATTSANACQTRSSRNPRGCLREARSYALPLLEGCTLISHYTAGSSGSDLLCAHPATQRPAPHP